MFENLYVKNGILCARQPASSQALTTNSTLINNVPVQQSQNGSVVSNAEVLKRIAYDDTDWNAEYDNAGRDEGLHRHASELEQTSFEDFDQHVKSQPAPLQDSQLTIANNGGVMIWNESNVPESMRMPETDWDAVFSS